MPISSNSIYSIVSHPSTGNSTMEPLGANGVFVGQWEDVSTYAIVYALCRVDQPGGVHFDYSMDGEIADCAFVSQIIDLSDATYVADGPRAKYFRIRYVNGPTPQSYCRIQATFSPTVSESGMAPVCTGISRKANSHVTRSVMFGQTRSGGYSPMPLPRDRVGVNLTARRLAADDGEVVLLAYTPEDDFEVDQISVYCLEASMSSYMAHLGDCSLESPPGNKLYTAPLSTMNGGSVSASFRTVSVPPGQEVRLVCTPSPASTQTWHGNLSGHLG